MRTCLCVCAYLILGARAHVCVCSSPLQIMNCEKMRDSYGACVAPSPPSPTAVCVCHFHVAPLCCVCVAMLGSGKLMHLLMDSRDPQISELLGFDPVIPIKTVRACVGACGASLPPFVHNCPRAQVYTLLLSKGGLALLEDPMLEQATHEVLPFGKTRPQIQREIKQKNAAQEALVRKYARGALTPDDVKLCMYSFNDHNSFITQFRDPVR